MNYSIGLDFGTESARALVVDVATGEALATAVEPYGHGVIDERCRERRRLPPDWALQHPANWLDRNRADDRVPLGTQARSRGRRIVGIGIDFTACTVFPSAADGIPLMQSRQFSGNRTRGRSSGSIMRRSRRRPGHRAGRGARRALAGTVRRPHLVGVDAAQGTAGAGDAPQVFAAADLIVEGGDWVIWQLTGRFARNACAAGYKGLWHKTTAIPAGVPAALHPGLAGFYEGKGGGTGRRPGGSCRHADAAMGRAAWTPAPAVGAAP